MSPSYSNIRVLVKYNILYIRSKSIFGIDCVSHLFGSTRVA